MSYRVHTTSADSVAIQWDTAANLDETFGFEHTEDEADDSYLVLNDTGSEEAWVMDEDPEALRKFAKKILRDLDAAQITTSPAQEIIDVVLAELAATEQAIKDDPEMAGDVAHYAADVVRALTRHFLGGE